MKAAIHYRAFPYSMNTGYPMAGNFGRSVRRTMVKYRR